MSEESVVILSTADFDADVWTNKQHIATRLARRFDVFYVNSLGLRQPHVSLSDFKRIAARLWPKGRRKPVSAADDSARVEVIRPIVLPFHKFRLIRLLNRLLVAYTVRTRLPKANYVLWTFTPGTYGIEKNAAYVIYHSVDLLHTFPGIPRRWLLSEERKLLNLADKVIASSNGVRDHLNTCGRGDVVLWPNVADTLLFSRAMEAPSARRHRAIFAGNLTSTKIDFLLLNALADEGVEIALAGPVSIDGSRDTQVVSELLKRPTVSYLGNLPPEQLADELAVSMVGLIPYLQNDYTAGVYPMKLYEYLAAGLCVVSTPIPSLRGEDVVGLSFADSCDFVAVVQAAISGFTDDGARHRSTAAGDHSWEQRMSQIEAMLKRAT